MTDMTRTPKVFVVKNSLDELAIPSALVTDLIFRILFSEGDVSFPRLVDILKISQPIVDEVLQWMQGEHLVEVAKAGQLGRYSYTYRLTDAGEERARSAFERTQYIGPVPVSVEAYCEAINLQTSDRDGQKVTPSQLKQALGHLILPDNFDRKIGPAVNSGTSLFLYGPPGNGKTTVAQIIGMLVAGADPIRLPYAVTIGGQIIKVHDSLIHIPAESPNPDSAVLRNYDLRWGLFRRPVLMVGGELTMEALELRFDPVAKFYEAPMQMKANGGMLLIDDFGRQRVSAQDLLNRWIVPLESRIDYFRLLSGQTIEIPFRQLIVFSTNLDPETLMDDAFLRRIQMKVELDSPDEKMFYQIFLRICKSYNVPFDRDTFMYLVDKWYRKTGRKMQSVHPRDLIRTAVSICSYAGIPPQLTPALIDEACDAYFVSNK